MTDNMTPPYTKEVEARLKRVADNHEEAALIWFQQPGALHALVDAHARTAADLRAILARVKALEEGLGVARLWLDSLIEGCDVDPDDTAININAVAPATGERRPLAKQTLAESLEKISALLNGEEP